jgi:hypothetical protein
VPSRELQEKDAFPGSGPANQEGHDTLSAV